jgi:hypothetical protein
MNKIKITSQLISWLLLGIVLVYFLVIKKPKVPEYEIITHTDTIRIEKPIKPASPYQVKALPKTITEYHIVKVKDLEELAKIKLKVLNDSLIIQDLKQRIAIHENYLKLFPTNPKLISLDLTKTNLSLSLLEIDGIAKKYDYPLSIDQFKYRWSDGGFSMKREISKEIRNRINYYVGVSGAFYSIQGLKNMEITPFTHFKIEKRWARSNLYLDSSLGLLNNIPTQFQMGIEYNLRKR